MNKLNGLIVKGVPALLWSEGVSGDELTTLNYKKVVLATNVLWKNHGKKRFQNKT